MRKQFAIRICNWRSSIQFYINNIARYIGIVVILSARRQYHKFNTFTIVLLSYKFIIYKSPNKTNQYIFLTMSSPTNTQSVPTSSDEIIAIFPHIPPTSPTSLYLKQSDLDNMHTDIKASNDKHHSEIKSTNKQISAMIATLTDTSVKTNKQEEKLTELSSKISTYEYHI